MHCVEFAQFFDEEHIVPVCNYITIDRIRFNKVYVESKLVFLDKLIFKFCNFIIVLVSFAKKVSIYF